MLLIPDIMQSLKFQARPHPCVAFGQRTPTRWELFRYSPIQYIARQAYEAYATLSPQATIRPGFHHPRDTIIRVVCISDTHGRHHRLPPLPPGDILIHAGDLTKSGTEPKIHKALSWLNSAPHPHKVFVAGNHDTALAIPERRDAILADYPDLIYLEDSGVELMVHGRPITLYGTPASTQCGGAAAFRTKENLKRWMGAIPYGTDILVTHVPPRYHRDMVGLGCRHLLARLWVVRPLLHVFGHIHAGHGVERAIWSAEQTKYEGVCQSGSGWNNVLRVAFVALRKTLWNSNPPFRSHKHTLLVNASSLGKIRDRSLRDPVVIDLALPSRRKIIVRRGRHDSTSS